MQGYLTSEQACEKLCELHRPDFLKKGMKVFIIAVIITSIVSLLFMHFVQATKYSTFFLVSGLSVAVWLFLLGATQVSIAQKNDGEYWGKWAFKPSKEDIFNPFIKRLSTLNSFSELPIWNQSIVLNGVILSGAMSTIVKSNPAGEYSNGNDVHRHLFKIEYQGQKRIGEFDVIEDSDSSEDAFIIEEGKPLIIFGECVGNRIKVMEFEEAMQIGKIYDGDFFPPP
jgi:hypothetical protein